MPGLAVQSGAKVDAGFGAEALADLPTAIVQPVRRRSGAQPIVDRDGPSAMGGTFEPGERLPPRRSGGAGALLAFLGVLVLGGGGAYLAMRGTGFSLFSLLGGGKKSSTTESIANLLHDGRAAVLLDTDDGFRQAISILDRAIEEDPSSIQARVELGEVHIIWAAYLLEDAHQLEKGSGAAGAQAAHALRAEAQAHLERARRVLEEPSGEGAQASPGLARAFAELLRVEGAPAAAVERYLERAGQRGGDEPELAYARAELALREGKSELARARLADATKPGPETGAKGLARAYYRTAAVAIAAGSKDEATRACDELFKISPKHDRGHVLCSFEAGPVAAPAVDAGSPSPVDLAPHVAPGKTPAAGSLAPPSTKDPLPNDYKSLVREADHLSENGKSAQARKLYERALELDPRGVAALTGLGYCDLDAERFMQSVDRFNAALAIDGSAGDAMLGLAESYKVRGQTARALEFYKKYLSAHPSGAKALMAQKNIRDLEPRPAKDSEGTGSAQERVNDKLQIKPRDSAEKSDPPLPRPPPEEPPL